jgi:hypothetical protein
LVFFRPYPPVLARFRAWPRERHPFEPGILTPSHASLFSVLSGGLASVREATSCIGEGFWGGRLWLRSGYLRRPKHEIAPNHLLCSRALTISCAGQRTLKRLLDSETCRKDNSSSSAFAVIGNETSEWPVSCSL